MKFNAWAQLVLASCLWLCTSLIPVSAFPEMIRHGYGNCTSCHISPSGGGILTNYGRELSKELLATWSGENEHLPLYGAVPLPKELRLGGDIRTVQTYVDTPQVREGRYFLMQADIEAAWVTEKLTVVASVGRDMGSPQTHEDDEWVSRRHYVLAPIVKSLTLRAGRFQKSFGLMIPDHTSEVRRGVAWDQSNETYNGELTYQNEEYTLAVTGVSGRPDDPGAISEKGVAINASRLFNSQYKLGASYFYGNSMNVAQKTGREIFGAYWALGFSENLYWLGELDWVRVAPEDADLIEGWASYTRLGYQVYPGIDLYLVHETRKTDRTKSELDRLRYGPGIQWTPRPHIILSGQWEKQTRYTEGKKATDNAWFIFQYYI